MTFLFAVAATAMLPVQKWEIKAPFTEGFTQKLAVQAEITTQGTMALDFMAVLTIKKKDDKGFQAELAWKDLQLDGQPIGEDLTAPAQLGTRGELVRAEDEELGETLTRMANPFFILYPPNGVQAGDKWSHSQELKTTDGNFKVTYDYEVKGVEKIGETEVLKIAVKAAESGLTPPMKYDGFYWIAKDGTIERLELNITDWPVPPMGGSFPLKQKATKSK
ncbi:MAG: hypothetical protein HND42_00745 [Armatimonadetes bacterium]|nr:hypothetical protein [Armatimonadota bacterium]